MSKSSRPPRGSWLYWRRLLRLIGIILLAVIVGLPLCGGVFSTVALLYVGCSENNATPDTYGDYTWEKFTIQAQAGGEFQGYFVHGTNGATIIFPPNFNVGRGNRFNEAHILMEHGYAVVLFESRRCADSGPLSLGYQEVKEVADVLDYLRNRSDVDRERIGIHGFSSAGATALMAAAQYPELRAIVAEGGYESMDGILDEQGGSAGAYLTTIFRWSMRLSYRIIAGNRMKDLNPLSVIDQIAPRPILLIYGSTESSLPGAYLQHKVAGANAELWVVEGAGHGNYVDIAPQEYEERVVAFFDQALLN